MKMNTPEKIMRKILLKINLDDEQEKIGSEDEENNYYSLGGDGHTDLDEDKGR